jgi:phosphoribosylanthranilate isomerase
VRVKICGVTRLEDAELAASLGAWAIGFVFWPGSPRVVDPARAREIIRKLPASVLTVGVFVDQPAETVEGVARQVGLGAVQLHGRETPDYARGLTRPVIKAIGLAAGGPVLPLADWAGMQVLLDVHDPERHGGTGRTVDWSQAAAIARARDVLLAGGLTADNVRDAVTSVGPSGIDVSSGVESGPGIKDAAKMRALFASLEGRLEVVR